MHRARSELWISTVAGMRTRRERLQFFEQNPRLCTRGSVIKLHSAVLTRVLADVDEADRLAKAALEMAGKSGDARSKALAERSAAHVLYTRSHFAQAVERYERASRAFEKVGDRHEMARTFSSGLQSLIYMGRYDQALEWSTRARDIFESEHDELRLARLDSNVGNLYYRQDRYDLALAQYLRAYDRLLRVGEPRDIAAASSNIAVCSISLHDFEAALSRYLEARAWCQEHDMPLLVAEADYNIAYLHFLRGEYGTALGLYQQAREQYREAGDVYHGALCDLDQGEVYLELNLIEEGEELVQRANQAFTELGIAYERAKTVVLLAIARHRSGDLAGSGRLFGEARALFELEANPVWPPLIDLYLAIVLLETGRSPAAARFARRSLHFFERTPLVTRTATCTLVLAAVDLQGGQPENARERCREVLDWIGSREWPAINFQAELLLGKAEEQCGHPEHACQAYQRARGWVETLRTQVLGDELRVSFLKNKLTVYEALVRLNCPGILTDGQAEPVFGLIERAKSRALYEMLSSEAPRLNRRAEHADLFRPLLRLRQELNEYYRQIEVAWRRTGPEVARRIEELWVQARSCERDLLSKVAELGSNRDRQAPPAALPEEFEGLDGLEAIRSAIPANATLLEYYQADDVVYACVLDAHGLCVQPLASASRVRGMLDLFRFQIGKFRLGPEYVLKFGPRLLAAARAHLRELHGELIEPLRSRLRGEHLVVVPHGDLHLLPFHALNDGQRDLIDDYTVSYAPSAGIFRLCATRQAEHDGSSLVMGVADEGSPHILEEVKVAARVLPRATLLVGEKATEAALRTLGKRARFVHIAAHARFRQDNPMFSSLRLGGSHLSLLDLQELDLRAELVTLSGCCTGLNVVVGGDELLGLLRGFLRAGARSVLMSLWEVHDRSTGDLMSLFYSYLGTSGNTAAALRRAMLELRREHPHPYHWAAFGLTGRYVG